MFAVLAGVLASCAPRQATTRVPDPLTVALVTWNMHAGVGELPRLIDDLAAGRLTGRRPTDFIVLLQEAVDGGPNDPATIARDRHLSFVFKPVRERGMWQSGNAILSTVPLSNAREFELPRERQRRAALIATTTVAGRELLVVNAHLENRVSVGRGLLFSDGPRGRQARALIDTLPSGYGVAGGDLNTWLGPDEPAWKAFARRFPDTPPDPLAPTVADRLVMDHLFFDVPDGWRVRRWVVKDQYGSDHHPVAGAISVPSES